MAYTTTCLAALRSGVSAARSARVLYAVVLQTELEGHQEVGASGTERDFLVKKDGTHCLSGSSGLQGAHVADDQTLAREKCGEIFKTDEGRGSTLGELRSLHARALTETELIDDVPRGVQVVVSEFYSGRAPQGWEPAAGT